MDSDVTPIPEGESASAALAALFPTSPFTNDSPERCYTCGDVTVRTFVNPDFISCSVHVVSSPKGIVLVDPGYYGPDLKAYLDSLPGIDAVLLTHAHIDHIFGINPFMAEHPGTPIYIGAADAGHIFDQKFNNSDDGLFPFYEVDRAFTEVALPVGSAKVAGYDIEVIPMPGHSAGLSAYRFMDEGLIFIGDLLAFNNVPRHDLPESNAYDLLESLHRFKGLNLPEGAMVFPGHGESIAYGELIATATPFTSPIKLGTVGEGGFPADFTEVEGYTFDGEGKIVLPVGAPTKEEACWEIVDTGAPALF